MTSDLTNNAIAHFTHPIPGHQLTPLEGGHHEFRCDGCKRLGVGKRYRCDANGCDFSLHDYCATYPRSITSFMHPNHALNLVVPNQQVKPTCAICAESVEGLFFRCGECQFDVHPPCTQFPEKLHHALDRIHPLILQWERIGGFCEVCRGGCTGWRYRCGACNLDVHLECVVVPFASGHKNNEQTSERRIPFQPPPQHPGYHSGVPYGPRGYFNQYRPGYCNHSRPANYNLYGPGHHNHFGVANYNHHGPGHYSHYGVGNYNHYGPGHYSHFGASNYNSFGPAHYNQFGPGYYNNYGPGIGMQYGPYMHPNNLMGQNPVGGGGGGNNSGGGRWRQSMFALLGHLGSEAFSNLISCDDIISLFSG